MTVHALTNVARALRWAADQFDPPTVQVGGRILMDRTQKVVLYTADTTGRWTGTTAGDIQFRSAA